MQDPQTKYPEPPFPDQKQAVPGYEADMQPKADHGELSYRGSGKLVGRKALITITSEELDHTFRTNIFSMFYLCKAAEEHLKPGSTVVNTTSVNAYKPNPQLLAYAATKAAIQNFTANLAQVWADKGIRVNCVAPGPIWTPLIPSTMGAEKVKTFGQDVPLKRAGQPAELAPVYVLLASSDSSYMTGSTVQVTGGSPTI